MFRAFKRLPFFKVVALVQVALLARRHLSVLTPTERRRASELVRHAHRLTREERQELMAIAMKLEPRAFAGAVADRMSPVPLPRRLTGRGSRSRSWR